MEQKTLNSFFGGGSRKSNSKKSTSGKKSQNQSQREVEQTSSSKKLSGSKTSKKTAQTIQDSPPASQNPKRRRKPVIPEDGSSDSEPAPLTKQGFKKVLSNEGLLFNPSKIPKFVEYGEQASKKKAIDHESYDPIKDSPFTPAQPSPFFIIADTFDILGVIKGKNSQDRKKTIIKNLFLTFMYNSPDELEELYLFSTLRMDSDYLQPDLGVGNEIMKKAAITATGMKAGKLNQELKKVSDLGLLVENKKAGKGFKTLGSFFGSTKKKTGRLTVRVSQKTNLKENWKNSNLLIFSQCFEPFLLTKFTF